MGYFLLALTLLVLVPYLYFVLTHLRPLSEPELLDLAKSRRSAAFGRHYYFGQRRVPLDLSFKKQMNPAGEFYAVSYPLSETPSLIASHLKFKKHEWVVIAFEARGTIDYLYMNKGPNGQTVSSLDFHAPEFA